VDRVTKVAAVLLGCSLATGAYAGTANDGRYFTLDLLAVQPDDRFDGVDSQMSAGGRFGFGFPIGAIGATRTSVETNLFFNPISFKGPIEANQMGLMADLVHAWDTGMFDPYVLAGAGIVEEEYGSGDSAQVHLALEVGGGVAWEAFKDGAVRAGITAQSVHNDQLPDGGDPFLDWRFNIGFTFPLGGSRPAPAPAPAKVVDSDGDGLADAQDKCPSTPASTADGCPAAAPVVQTDADGDGVYDSQDTCAGTLPGLKVDAAGCAVQTEAQSVVLKGVTFLPGSATLTADAKTVLDNAALSLSGDKSLKVELGGYTDSQGKDAANLALSQKRAESARKYLIGKGIEAERLTAKGYGEASPIADNNTVEGRAENRRVELKVVK
jgi:OmpA-OmpF porin, OOP family